MNYKYSDRYLKVKGARLVSSFKIKKNKFYLCFPQYNIGRS